MKKAREVGTLLCTKCANTMRIPTPIADLDVLDKLLRHLGLWQQCMCATWSRAPPRKATVIELWPDYPFPDYDIDLVIVWASV